MSDELTKEEIDDLADRWYKALDVHARVAPESGKRGRHRLAGDAMDGQRNGIDRGRDRQLTNGADRDGVAVGRLALHVFDGKPSAGAGAVLDDDRLAENLGKLRPDDARQQIGAAARGKAEHEVDRLVRIAGGRIGLPGDQPLAAAGAVDRLGRLAAGLPRRPPAPAGRPAGTLAGTF